MLSEIVVSVHFRLNKDKEIINYDSLQIEDWVSGIYFTNIETRR